MTTTRTTSWEQIRTEGRKAALKAWQGLAVSHCETVGGVPCDMVARDSAGRVVSVLTNRFEIRSV